MKHTRLIDFKDDGFFRGWIFRCNKATWPYEDKVAFFLKEEPDSPSGYSLMVISGYKAGLTLVYLPAEAKYQGIGKQWLIDNWAKWIYPECPVNEVDVCRYDIATPENS